MGLMVFICTWTGRTIEINLCNTEEQFKNITVEELKRRITEKEGIPGDQILLTFKGKQLEDGRRLSEYGVEHKSTIDMFLNLRGGGKVDEQESSGKKEGAAGMGDRDGRNSSMDRLASL